MTAVRELTDMLAAAGLDPGEVSALMMRVGAELAAAMPSKGALRTRKWRVNRPSQNVTGDAPETPKPTVTERHQTSQTVTGDSASLSSLLPDDQKKHSEKKEKREAKRAMQLPIDWRPDEPAWQATVTLIGLERCELELKKFHRHAADKGRVSKNWNAAWGNWVDRAIDYGAKNGNGPGANRTNQAAGPAQTRDATVIASMARTLERRRQERAANQSDDEGFSGGAGAAGADDAESGAPRGDDGACQQLALLPRTNTGRG